MLKETKIFLWIIFFAIVQLSVIGCVAKEARPFVISEEPVLPPMGCAEMRVRDINADC